jgi:outer membrane protein assembly factor BamB
MPYRKHQAPFAVMSLVLAISCGRDPANMAWKYRTVFEILPRDHNMLHIQVVGDRVLFCGGDGWERKGHLGAVHLKDGKRIWKHTVGWCLGALVLTDSVAIGWGSQPKHMSMKAAHVGTGRLLWERTFESGFQTRDHVGFGKHIYLTAGAHLRRVEAATGRIEQVHLPTCDRMKVRSWTATDGRRLLYGCGTLVFEVPSDSFAPRVLFQIADRLRYPAGFTIDGSLLFIADEGTEGKMLAVNLHDGRTLWQRPIRAVYDAPTIARDTAYFPTFGAGLLAVNKRTGAEYWRVHTVRSFYRPLHHNGKLYVSDSRKDLLELDARTGAVLRRFRAKGEVQGVPVIAGELLMYGDNRGNLYAVRLAD